MRDLSDRYEESQTLTNLGILYQREGDEEKAIALWQTALKGFPTDSAAAYQLEFWLQSSRGVDLQTMQPDVEIGDRPQRLGMRRVVTACIVGAIALIVVIVLLVRRI
ncbi:MAG: hypothetical protein HC879_04025 [Leptolyngbyaceae cyanobacterium SL_5_9]|nr:hypothetical protein [Leptolyngbyaceae cyanobacterium SL_5_9]